MLNVLVPIANESNFFPETEYLYPKTLAEINGQMMIKIVIDSLQKIPGEKKFIFIIRKTDEEHFHFGNILRLLAQSDCEVVQVEGKTQGAACSCLMAIDFINDSNPLVITNCDQLIDVDLGKILSSFQAEKLDAGTICFESVHPKWSYVKQDENGLVCEAAEKRPISNNAIAGFYYFHQGCDFVSSSMKMIEKNVNLDGYYYIAPVFNEMILASKRIGVEHIPSSKYHSFYSPQKIKEYETILTESRKIEL